VKVVTAAVQASGMRRRRKDQAGSQARKYKSNQQKSGNRTSYTNESVQAMGTEWLLL
jgi:hypothetical protein